MNNFRETKEKKDCLGCHHFCSWSSFMGDDDLLEPDDLGKCENKLNEDNEGEELVCGEGEVCDLWITRQGN
jgi:hypothetical protein|tara:strand:- start:300 stop:512 length:213 start_codon:yes stop_codon:yes gene_type:complete